MIFECVNGDCGTKGGEVGSIAAEGRKSVCWNGESKGGAVAIVGWWAAGRS